MIGRVLILATDPATAERWMSCLRGEPQLQVVAPCEDSRETAEIDVVLTNSNPVELGDLAAASNAIVVAVAPAVGEVSISADCPARELAQICRLAAELAQLRRANSVCAAAPLLDLSLVDELTGLPNRRAWQQELARQLLAAEQQAHSL